MIRKLIIYILNKITKQPSAKPDAWIDEREEEEMWKNS
jgi:hypothetical protein